MTAVERQCGEGIQVWDHYLDLGHGVRERVQRGRSSFICRSPQQGALPETVHLLLTGPWMQLHTSCLKLGHIPVPETQCPPGDLDWVTTNDSPMPCFSDSLSAPSFLTLSTKITWGLTLPHSASLNRGLLGGFLVLDLYGCTLDHLQILICNHCRHLRHLAQ